VTYLWYETFANSQYMKVECDWPAFKPMSSYFELDSLTLHNENALRGDASTVRWQ